MTTADRAFLIAILIAVAAFTSTIVFVVTFEPGLHPTIDQLDEQPWTPQTVAPPVTTDVP